MRRRHVLAAGLSAAGVWSLGGCASPSVPATVPQGPFFYPPTPAAPRIQHLASLSSTRDFAAPRTGFAEFIAGKDKKGLRLAQPYGAALWDGKLLVADTGGPGLVVFDLKGRTVALQPGAGAGRMRRPINVTVDRDGTRYITDTALDRVLVFDREQRFLRTLGTDGQFRPTDAAIVDDRLYVVDILHHQIQVLDKLTGRLLSHFGRAGSGTGELFQPTNIAIGPSGDAFIVDTGNFRVQRFRADGTHIRSYGEAGNVAGTFARPKGISVDRSGRIYVGDAAFQNVQIFEDGGRMLMDFGRPMDGLEGLNLPAAVRIDYDHTALFATHAAPGFNIEHLVIVVSQFGPNKVDIFGYGRMAGIDYDSPAASGKA